MSDRLFKGYSTFSNHGTTQGIIPRFYLQMVDMAQFALDNDKRIKLDTFLDKNISDFTDFYDTFVELQKIYNDYRDGLINGKYYYLDEKLTFRHDRSKELILKKQVKDFFISGRLVVYNFGKSGVIDDNGFVLNNFLIVSDKNFEKNKTSCLGQPSGAKYQILLQLIEQARTTFLTKFNQIRADFEHQNLQVADFKVEIVNGEIEVIEPCILKGNLSGEIETYYNQILEFIEILMAYYYGQNAYEKTNGFMTLFERDEYDYSNMKYRYVVQPSMYESGLTKLL